MRAWPFARGWIALLLVSLPALSRAAGDEPAPPSASRAFRTDTAGAELPWYQLRPGEFPPKGSEHRVVGELLEADFIHRRGRFRDTASGELVNFALLPYGSVRYLNTDADLRDAPLGTRFTFFLYQDAAGDFTQAAMVADDVSLLGEQASAEQNSEALRAHGPATQAQRKRHTAFLKQRGLPAWIDRVDGKRLTVTFFGDPADMAALCKDEGIVPQQWAAERRSVDAAVANEELRTYNPPVDRQHSIVAEFQTAPTDVWGSSGLRWVIEPRLLLEGFRKGHFVRIFAHPSWRVEDMPFGENVYTEAPDAKQEIEEAIQYPYRTDFANHELPWYQLRPGVFPPLNSHHQVSGELTKIDAQRRRGEFRPDGVPLDGGGDLVAFTMPPFGCVVYLNADADLEDVPLGARCQFYLYPDAQGAFTQACVIQDEFSRLVSYKHTYRVESLHRDQGRIVLATEHAAVKNYHGNLVTPPFLGHAEFRVDAETRVWKADRQIKLDDLAVGDELLLNTTGRTSTSRGRCTDLWVGAETIKHATERQVAKHSAALKQRGLPAWIDSVQGKELTILFFADHRKDFQTLLGGDPWGKTVHALLADDELNPLGAGVAAMRFKNHLPETATAGTYGCSGIRWVIEPEQPSEDYRPGRVLRVFQNGWLTPEGR